MTTSGARARRDLGRHVVEVGQPVVRLVAEVVDRRSAGERDRRGPERVVGRRDQHLVAVVEQRVHAHRDQLGGAVAEIDVVDGHALDMLLLRVVDDRLARREQALGVGVAGRVRQVPDHVLDDLVGRLEPERGDVADVELDDVLALVLHLARLLEHRAADVVADVGELARTCERVARGKGSGDAEAVGNPIFDHRGMRPAALAEPRCSPIRSLR